MSFSVQKWPICMPSKRPLCRWSSLSIPESSSTFCLRDWPLRLFHWFIEFIHSKTFWNYVLFLGMRFNTHLLSSVHYCANGVIFSFLWLESGMNLLFRKYRKIKSSTMIWFWRIWTRSVFALLMVSSAVWFMKGSLLSWRYSFNFQLDKMYVRPIRCLEHVFSNCDMLAFLIGAVVQAVVWLMRFSPQCRIRTHSPSHYAQSNYGPETMVQFC